ncbi:metallophosphoesterase [Candidatus Omnitrophota bacterium]
MAKPKTSISWVIFVAVMLILQIAYVDAFFIEPNWIKVDRVRIADPGLAKALGGLKVIHISDLHIEKLGFVEMSLIRIVERLKPDIIFITGDVAETRQGAQPVADVLSLLEPKFRAYMVIGESPGDSLIAELISSKMWDKADVSILNHEAIRLNLKDRDDAYFWLVNPSSPKTLHELVKDIPKEEPVIVINHFPEIVKQAAVEGLDLVLAGNTHGGQCGIPILRKIFPYSTRSAYISGLFKIKDTLLYVNRGITSQKGIRFFCRPEVTVLEFVPKGGMRRPKVLKQDESY